MDTVLFTLHAVQIQSAPGNINLSVTELTVSRGAHISGGNLIDLLGISTAMVFNINPPKCSQRYTNEDDRVDQ